MGKKLSKKAKIAVIVICAIFVPFLCIGCFYLLGLGLYGLSGFFIKDVFDVNGKKYLKYIIKYMDAIPITYNEYKLAEPDDSKYSSSTAKNRDTIIVDGTEKKIDVEWNGDKDFTLTVDNQTININEEFMAEKSPEYVTISEMWFRYRDDMENYNDNMPNYSIHIFDYNIFIVTRYRSGGGAWWTSYLGSMPVCLFKYDIENDAVFYAGYLMREGTGGSYQIEQSEQ